MQKHNWNKYDPRLKIKYEWNPMAQVTIGKFDGYMLIFESYCDTREYKNDDEVRFTFKNQSDWNKCVKYIKENWNQLIKEYRGY
jgi:hypothetical protein